MSNRIQLIRKNIGVKSFSLHLRIQKDATWIKRKWLIYIMDFGTRSKFVRHE